MVAGDNVKDSQMMFMIAQFLQKINLKKRSK